MPWILDLSASNLFCSTGYKPINQTGRKEFATAKRLWNWYRPKIKYNRPSSVNFRFFPLPVLAILSYRYPERGLPYLPTWTKTTYNRGQLKQRILRKMARLVFNSRLKLAGNFWLAKIPFPIQKKRAKSTMGCPVPKRWPFSRQFSIVESQKNVSNRTEAKNIIGNFWRKCFDNKAHNQVNLC